MYNVKQAHKVFVKERKLQFYAALSGVNPLQLHFSGSCFKPVQCEKCKM